jgi:hypothetical protein
MLIRDSVRNPKLLPGDGTIDLSEPERVTDTETDAMDCDVAFFDCLGSDECNECFYQMKQMEIDWAGVTQNTQCETIITTLQTNGLCKPLGTTKSAAQDLFCQTFRACVYFDDDDDNAEGDDGVLIDCDSLTECNWPGIHKSFVGDGVCHDSYFNTCYNTAVCGYDGGDCCKDTCKTAEDAYLQCGSDGYTCRDPKSSECDPTLSLKCPPSSYKNSTDPNSVIPDCTKDQTLYRLVMYDSFGDGWEQTTMTITPTTGATAGQNLTPVFTGGLTYGAEGTVVLCLSLNPMCYHVDVSGGNWGREASWLVRAYNDGSPAIASGGGSMSCDFSVAGGSCENTCTGRSNRDPSQDQDYKDFKNMYKCIDDKCMLQASACRADPACLKCFQEDVPDYCFAIDAFLAVTDCSMCKCSDMEESYFCDEKQAPGIIIPTPRNGGQELQPVQCTPAETLAGSSALLDFSKCMAFDKTPLMMTNFDTNNFGDLDTFETCAHSFRDNADHGGHTALGCLQVLVNAMNEESREGEPTEVIAQLAGLLYYNGQSFCDCAKQASTDCPLCPSFYNFKTLLYESLDACMALDDIDCDAWNEFQKPCKVNLMEKFGSVDFARKEQCDFVVNNCGGAGPFPSFRRLDCEKELPVSSWDFYSQYSKFCISADNKGNANPPVAPPAPAPVTPRVETKPPTPYQPVKPSNIKPPPARAPSSSNEDKSNTRPTYKSPDEKSKSHWFRNVALIGVACGIGYYIYKKQSDGFSFVRYRRMTNFGSGGGYGMDDSDMFSGLALESSTNFEPPSLPPTPMSMPNNGGYGM